MQLVRPSFCLSAVPVLLLKGENKMEMPTKQDAIKLLDVFDPEMAGLLHKEEKRQFETIGLIASENVASPLCTALEGSVFTNKNTEGAVNWRTRLNSWP